MNDKTNVIKAESIPILLPRQLWLVSRINDCVQNLNQMKLDKDWDWSDFIEHAKNIAEELLYVTTEWEKYYAKDE